MKSEVEKLGFCLRKISSNKASTPCHIALFIAIYNQWREQGSQKVVYVTRSELMSLTGIKSTATYHKTIKSLVTIGLIVYEPSYNPILGSAIEILLNN